MNRFPTIIKLLIFLILPAISMAQGAKKSSLKNEITGKPFHIFYVDNSKIGMDGMTEVSLFKLKNKLDSVVKNDKQKFLLYVSNGIEPIYTEDAKAYEGIMNQIYSRSMSVPNQQEDKKRLSDMVLEKVVANKGNVKLYFFLSDMMTKSIAEKPSTLVKLFPKEIQSALENNAVEVTIYYSNTTGRVNADEVQKALNFYEINEFKSNVTYNLVHL